MKRISLYILLAVAVVGTAGYFWLSNSGSKGMTYRTDKVSRGDIVVQVRATGTINPVKTVEVGSQVSGIISKINVDFNSDVKKGEVIAVIDSTLLYASVKEARANLEHNQAQVNQAERDFKRSQDLFSKQLIAQSDLDVATTAYETAKAQKMQTEAALDRAAVNLRYVVIRSPIDGVIISRDVDVGQTVAASLQTPKLFEIANDLKQMQVEASVDEADIGQIKVDEPVTFTVDAYPDEQFRGRVSQVRLAPVTVQNVVTYTVVIEVPNPDLKLRPGMTATVSILVEKRENVLRVPALAIRFQPPIDIVEKMKSDTQDSPGGAVAGQQTADNKQQWKQGGGGRHRDSSATGRNDNAAKRMMARLWQLGGPNGLKSSKVTTGLNDNRYVELLTTDLKEGDDVIIGTQGPETASASGQQTNPFQQRPTGGGGGRGRGF